MGDDLDGSGGLGQRGQQPERISHRISRATPNKPDVSNEAKERELESPIRKLVPAMLGFEELAYEGANLAFTHRLPLAHGRSSKDS